MKRIIFVDDEPHVLSGLQRMLRPMRQQWEMEFFNSGADALTSLDDNPCDVVVSDMRMPSMDGAELLCEVRKMCPDAVRIALSGQTDADLISRCMAVADRFLAKPCDADHLIGTVSRACEQYG